MKLEPEVIAAAASRGDVGAQVLLAHMNQEGQGVPKSLDQAFHWYVRAAEGGSEIAHCAVSLAYAHGLGVERAPELALDWAKRGIERGFASAAILLAHLVDLGYGSAADRTRVRSLLKQAADRGDGVAASILSIDLAGGLYGNVDTEMAATASGQGSDSSAAVAAGELARRLEHGDGISKDLAGARAKYEQAAALGNPLAALRLYMAYSFGDLELQADPEKAAYFGALADRLKKRFEDL